MIEPVHFNGNLSDEDVDQIFQYVDQASLYSCTDGLLVTSDKIYEIIGYPHTGNRVNVYVRTWERGPTDVLYLEQITNSLGLTDFRLSDFKGSKP